MWRGLLIVLAVAALAPLWSQVPARQAASEHSPGKIRSSWGKRLNPQGAIPASGFRAIYFDRSAPRAAVFEENVDGIAIKYAWSDFHNIKSDNFAAYWIGKLHFAEPTTKQISVSQSWAKSRILIDGEIVFDGESSDNSFTHQFAPGEHVIEVEYINNWHTVEYKVTIEDVVERLSGSEVAAHLRAQSSSAKTLYYVGLYESDRKDTSVDVAVPATGRPAILWLASYEAIDWDVSALAPGSTVILGSRSPGSTVRGAGAARVLHLKDAWSIHNESRRCSCSAASYHCDNEEDLGHAAGKLRDLAGLPLSAYFVRYRASAVTLQPYDHGVARRIWRQREASDAAQRECAHRANPDFDNIMN